MSQWKLFDGPAPDFSRPEWLAAQPWMRLEQQPGFGQRAKMVADLARMVCALRPVASVTDLGCGDGALLAMLTDLAIPMWGYDANLRDVAYGKGRGLDIRPGDILGPGLDIGELIIASEVAEHLADPEGFLTSLPGRLLIVSSPSLETLWWHNDIHAWAWDTEGYRDLVARCGWEVAYQAECDGGENCFAGIPGKQRFQAIVAVRR